MVKVIWKRCLVDELKFLVGIISLVGWNPVSVEPMSGSKLHKELIMEYGNKN